MSTSQAIGTAAETAVVRAIQAHGFPHAERRRPRGRTDPGDITGIPGVCWQVKGGQEAKTATDERIIGWLHGANQQRNNVGADVHVLVVQRAGIGPKNAHMWWAVMYQSHALRLGTRAAMLPDLKYWRPIRMHLVDACRLLRVAGYGAPLAESELPHVP